MEEKEHQERHQELHKKLDELLADYISYSEGSIKDPIHRLINWSHQQTQKLDHEV